MGARAEYLSRYGHVEPWLEHALDAMSGDGWDQFSDQCDRTGRLPRSLRDTMPRTPDGLIVDPDYCAEPLATQLRAEWEVWRKVWGAAPHDYKPAVKVYRGTFRD